MNPAADALSTLISGEEAVRVRRINERWDAYMGRMTKPLRVSRNKAGQPIDDNVLLPLPRVIVDKGRSALFGEDLRFEVDPAYPRAEAAQAYLDQVWEWNEQATTLQNWALAGGIAGHAFLRLHLRPDVPRITVVDPATVRAFWNPDDIADVIRYRIEYLTADANDDPIARRQEIYLDEAGRWIIEDWVGNAEKKGWRMLASDVWPYAFAPIVDNQNLPAPSSFYGLSDLEPSVLDLIKGINRTVSNLQRILRYHAHPKTIAKGMSPDDLRVGVDDVLFIPESGTLENLEMTSDLNSSMQFYERLMDALFETARIPGVSRGKLDSGPLSGVALRILYQPLLEQTSDKRRLYGDALSDLNERLLTIGGFDGAEATTHWPELVPTDPMADAQVALALKDVGVSTDTLVARLGFDPVAEAQKNADAAVGMVPGPLDNLGPLTAPAPAATTMPVDELARRVDAAGVLIRSGFEPNAAIRAVGLDPIDHLDLIPVTVKPPTDPNATPAG